MNTSESRPQDSAELAPSAGWAPALLLGDCLERMAEIPDGSVDMVLCDLPYGTTACKWDSVIPFGPLWAHYRRVCKKNAAIVLTASQPFTSALVMSNLDQFKYEYTWIKTKCSGFQNAKKMPMKKHEQVLVFYRKQPIFNQQSLVQLEKLVKTGRLRSRNLEQHNLGIAGKVDHKTNHSGWQNSLLFFANPSGRGHLHPTQKPVALMEYLIRTYTNEGETVLDNTAGSFTTGVAAFRTGRKFIGIERDPDYFKIGVCRLCDEARALSLCGTTDRDILSWKVDWPFQEIQNPYTALCDELVSNPQ